jgi:hypothetical protein
MSDRNPDWSPLLQSKRCQLYVALDDKDVSMTTHLRGLETTSLPFNRGDDDISNLELVPHLDACASFLSKSQPPCLQCDRTARSRGSATATISSFAQRKKVGGKGSSA